MQERGMEEKTAGRRNGVEMVIILFLIALLNLVNFGSGTLPNPRQSADRVMTKLETPFLRPQGRFRGCPAIAAPVKASGRRRR